MDKILYIKYGELTLKGKNKMVFINRLFTNIQRVLKQFVGIKIVKNYDSMYIENVTEINEVLSILQQVPGILFIVIGHVVTRDIEEIVSGINNQLTLDKLTTFKIETKRMDKTFEKNSLEISCEIGAKLLKANGNLKVNVKKPKIHITVEIKKDRAIFYFEKIKGFGGFPLGVNGRVLMLISGGIDSPVAAKLLMKKGFHVDFLTFISPPHTSEKALDKVRDLIKIITLNGSLEKPTLYIANFTKLQHEIAHISNNSYQITIMRRYFLRIAQRLCEANNYDAIGTGESLGQVASQTIESLSTIQNVLNDIVVLRPLLTYDKSEIVDLAIKFGTYDTSILPYADSCSLFVPARPVTKPTARTSEKLEKELELANDIYDFTFEKCITIEKIG